MSLDSEQVFWLNIAKFEVNWCYRYCFNLFSNLRNESELRQYHCRNSTKVGEREIKSRREIFYFRQYQFLLSISAARVGARSVSACKENQMMGKKKIGNCGNEEKKREMICLQHFYNKS